MGDTILRVDDIQKMCIRDSRIGGGLLLLQKQVHLVDVVAGRLVSGTVDGNAVPHLIPVSYTHLSPDTVRPGSSSATV